MKEPKQTIIVRKDLKMRKGKIAAQVAHASMKVFFDMMHKVTIDELASIEYRLVPTPEMVAWKEGIFTKIVLGCQSEDDIRVLEAKAKALNIPHAVIIDNGLTEFHGVKTVTCIALGPYDAEKLEELTSEFALL